MRFVVEISYEIRASSVDDAMGQAERAAFVLGGEDAEVIGVEPILDEEEEGE